MIIVIIKKIYPWCYVPVLLACILDFLDKLLDELKHHAVVLFLFVLDHHYEAVFEQQCCAPTVVIRQTYLRLISIILVNKPALQIFVPGLLSEFGA